MRPYNSLNETSTPRQFDSVCQPFSIKAFSAARFHPPTTGIMQIIRLYLGQSHAGMIMLFNLKERKKKGREKNHLTEKFRFSNLMSMLILSLS